MLINAKANIDAKGTADERARELLNIKFQAINETQVTGDGGTPLMWAFYSKRNTLDNVKILLQAGADVKCQNVEGNIPLHMMVIRVISRSIKRTDNKDRWGSSSGLVSISIQVQKHYTSKKAP